MKQLFVFLCLFPALAQAQSFRGLAVLDDNTAWVSGSKGFVLRTTNGAKSWDTLNPKDYERKDFRDIHAWDRNTAIIMSSGDSAVILKTTDGGKSWKKVYEDNSPGVFLDAMDFDGPDGYVIGDPRRRIMPHNPFDTSLRFDLLFSNDKGEIWKQTSSASDTAQEGEALFAASGSNLKIRTIRSHYAFYEFITGGSISRYKRHFIVEKGRDFDTLPLTRGEGCGAFSLYSFNNIKVVVGGCWQKPNSSDSAACYYDLSEKRWMLAKRLPQGYRSCVTGTRDGKRLYCTGPSGTEVSFDHGKTWEPISVPEGDGRGYNVCASTNKYLWLAGDKGRIVRSDRRKQEKAD